MTESLPHHDTKRENGTLRIEKKVYIFQGKKTTNTKTLDKWLRNEFDMDGIEPGIPYNKMEAVDVERKAFKEVEQ